MTQPPFESGPAQPPGFGAPPAGPPGQTPWGTGQPLAAANQVSKKRFVLVMAFFAVLLVVSVVGFALTTGEEVTSVLTDHSAVRPEPVSTVPEQANGPVPDPVTYRGSGSKVLKIRRPEPGDALVYLKGRPGDGLFTVFGVDANGRRSGFVVTSLEAYEGVRVLDVTSFTRTTSLEIQAAGPWTVQIRSARSARAFRGSVSGTGDTVLNYTGPAGVAAIRGGQPGKPFVVMVREGGFPRMLATAVGAFNGEKPLPKGPVLVEVQATGRWSIRVR